MTNGEVGISRGWIIGHCRIFERHPDFEEYVHIENADRAPGPAPAPFSASNQARRRPLPVSLTRPNRLRRTGRQVRGTHELRRIWLEPRSGLLLDSLGFK